jgi:hypothetical protein
MLSFDSPSSDTSLSSNIDIDKTPTQQAPRLPTNFVLKPPGHGDTTHQRASTAPVGVPVPAPRLKPTPPRQAAEKESVVIEQVVLKPVSASRPGTANTPPTLPKPQPTANTLSTLKSHSPSDSFSTIQTAQPFISHSASSSKIPISKPTVISKPISKATILCVTRSNVTSTLSSSNNSLHSLSSAHSTSLQSISSSNSFLYTIQVETISKQTYQIQKHFDDFFELHLNLLGHFPECAGIVVEPTAKFGSLSNSSTNVSEQRILPQLPQQMMYVSEQIASSRINTLQIYINVFDIN